MPVTRLNIPYFASFTAFTPEVPKLYWDVKSQEQRILALCKDFHKMMCYANMLADNLNSLSNEVEDVLSDFKEDMQNAFEEFENSLTEQLEAQNKRIESLIDEQNAHVEKELTSLRRYVDAKFDEFAESKLMFDITCGEFRPAKQTMRRIGQALAFDHKGNAQLVSEVAKRSVSELSNHTVYNTAFSNREHITMNEQIPQAMKG